MKLLILVCIGVNAGPIFINKEQANTRLRAKRANDGVFEEMWKEPSMQRECMDEKCSYKEVLEIFQGDEVKSKEWWRKATRMCDGNACSNKGTKTCVNLWKSRECICREGFTKTKEIDDCSLDIDECAENSSLCNTGTCNNLSPKYECLCDNTGYTGEHCEVDVNECETENICNNGSCINSEGGYSCTCNEGWTGEACDVDINECELEDKCLENSDGCINLQGSYKCLCIGGYNGTDCTTQINECDMNPCPEFSICVDLENSFTCNCPEWGCGMSEEEYLAEKESIWVPEVVTDAPEIANETVTEITITDDESTVADEIISSETDAPIENPVTEETDYPTNEEDYTTDESSDESYENIDETPETTDEPIASDESSEDTPVEDYNSEIDVIEPQVDTNVTDVTDDISDNIDTETNGTEPVIDDTSIEQPTVYDSNDDAEEENDINSIENAYPETSYLDDDENNSYEDDSYETQYSDENSSYYDDEQ